MKLYRYEDALSHKSLECRLIEFDVLRETEKGYWFVESWLNNKAFETMAEKKKRWVSKDSRKRYCYPEKSKAWDSYIIRKYKQLGHLERQYEWAKKRVQYIENNPETPDESCIEMGFHGLVQFDDY